MVPQAAARQRQEDRLEIRFFFLQCLHFGAAVHQRLQNPVQIVHGRVALNAQTPLLLVHRAHAGNLAEALKAVSRARLQLDRQILDIGDDRLELLLGAVRDDLAVIDDGDPGADFFDFLHVMARVDDRAAGFVELLHRLQNVIPGLGIDADGRFVHDDQTRLVRDGAGDVQPALHAAGEGGRAAPGAVAEADEFERFFGPLLQQLAPQAVEAGEEGHVLVGGHVVVDGQVLRHDAQVRLGVAAMLAAVLAEDADLTRARLQQRGDHVDRRALARSVGAEEAEDFAFLHVQSHIVHRDEIPEFFGQTLNFQHVHDPHSVSLIHLMLSV
ncbi:hypothetical protein BN871_CZ_00200 [Paenibacillus sp. P22]|nr:hypothetical protein BN871_CZ_00200 [Paenibacillus sp. P22]